MAKKDIFYYTKRKITLISIAIVFVCLFAFALITQFLYSSRLFHGIDRELMQQKNMIMSLPPEMLDENSRPFPNERFFVNPPPMAPNLIVAIYDQGVVKGISPNSYFSSDNLLAILKASDDSIKTVQYQEYNFRGIRFKHGKREIQLLINVDSELKSIKQLFNAITISLIALVIIALMLSAFLASKVIKPVRAAYDKQVFFVQDASHEMRTPLAVIKGKLEILANSWGESIDDNFEHISKMMSEIRGLEKLSNDLLFLTKEDIGEGSSITKLNLNRFIEDISDFYIDLAEMQDKEFQLIRSDKETEVEWDCEKVKRALIILLENAFKYTPANGKILLSSEEAGRYIKIIVRDNGIGIKEEDQTRIFDRFFRSSEARAHNSNGSGIGLSLLKSISKTLGISIKFTSEYGAGTEFKILIPKIMKA